MEADHGGDAEFVARQGGLFQVLGQHVQLGQCFVPSTRFEQQLAQREMRLRHAERRADLLGELPGLPGRGQRLLVPVEIDERDGLVDLQQQPQIGQGRIGLGHGQRPVEQRQCVGRTPRYPVRDGQHVQRPAHGPVVARLRRCRERPVGDLPRLFDLPDIEVRPGRHHQQPGAMPGRDSGRQPAPDPAWPATRRTNRPACGTAPASSAGRRVRRVRRCAPGRVSRPARP